MTETPFCMVYVTARDRAEAEALARRTVEKGLAACANVLGEIRSFYRWDGEIRNDSECAVIFKTRTAMFEALKDEIVAAHSYECPCVVALPLIDGSAPYLAWLGEQTMPG